MKPPFLSEFEQAMDPLTARNKLGIRDGTSTSAGLVEFATDVEATSMAATDRALTPANILAFPGSPVGADISSFSAHKNAVDQGGVASSVATLITFSTEVYDVGNNFTSDTWTPPAGKVAMKAAFFAGGTITVGSFSIAEIWKDGAVYKSAYSCNPTNLAVGHIVIDDATTGTNAYTFRVTIQTAGTAANVIGSTQATYFMGTMIN